VIERSRRAKVKKGDGAAVSGLIEDAFFQSDFAICITDPRGILLRVNDAYRNLYKYPDQESLIGKPVSIVRSPLTPESLYQDMWKTIAAGGIWRGQMNNQAKDGSEVYIHLTISPIRRNGIVTGFLGLSMDRAQQVILEKQLMHANKLMAIGTLGAGLAHELNNPLASILLDAEYLRDIMGEIIACPAADQARQAAISIIQGSEKMRRVLEHLLLYAKPEASQANSTIALAPFLEDCFLFVAHHLQGLGIEVDLDAEPGLHVIGNRKELESVIHNLLSNSMDAFAACGRKDKRIQVRAVAESGSALVRIDFKDNAGGIDPEVMTRIFEPFFTTKGGSGSGLGLSLSRHIMAAHGGQIECESAADETVFHLVLPVSKADGRGKVLDFRGRSSPGKATLDGTANGTGGAVSPDLGPRADDTRR
jgi:PAS domain S-box-containing protein